MKRPQKPASPKRVTALSRILEYTGLSVFQMSQATGLPWQTIHDFSRSADRKMGPKVAEKLALWLTSQGLMSRTEAAPAALSRVLRMSRTESPDIAHARRFAMGEG